MKQFKFFCAAMLAAVTVFASSCKKDDNPGGGEDATFKIVVGTKTHESVKVTVTTTSKDTYYVFCTDNLTGDINEVIQEQVAGLSDIESELKTGNKPTEITGLSPETEYRAIVTGLLADGTIYGTPAEKKFKTEKAPIEYAPNENWKITYAGKQDIENRGKQDVLTVESSDEIKYFTSFEFSKSLSQVDIKEYIAYQIEYLNMAVSQGLGKWDDILASGDMNILCGIIEPNGDTYTAIMFGVEIVDGMGVATGHYQLSEPFNPEKVTGSDEYNKWVGNWTATGDNSQTYEVTIAESTGDYSYVFSGWEATEEGQLPPFYMYYDGASKKAVFASQLITVVQGMPVYLLGTKGDGEQVNLITGNYNIATGAFSGETATFNAEEVELQGGEKFISDRMQLVVQDQQGYGLFTDTAVIPTFPMTLAKSSAKNIERVLALNVAARKAMRPYKGFKLYNTFKSAE